VTLNPLLINPCVKPPTPQNKSIVAKSFNIKISI
jgi:hypothetical protein